MFINIILYLSSFSTSLLSILLRLLNICIMIIQFWHYASVMSVFLPFQCFAFMDVVILVIILVLKYITTVHLHVLLCFTMRVKSSETLSNTMEMEVRQWMMSWYTSLMTINKISPSVDHIIGSQVFKTTSL